MVAEGSFCDGVLAIDGNAPNEDGVGGDADGLLGEGSPF